MRVQRLITVFLCGLVTLPTVTFTWSYASAQSPDIASLQRDITERGSRLSEIEREIEKYNQELRVVGAERQTLQRALDQLTLERRRIQAELSRTQNLIGSTDLEINKLALEIKEAEQSIEINAAAIAQIIRSEYKSGDDTMVEILLQNKRFSDLWDTLEAKERIRNSLTEKVISLGEFRRTLETKQNETRAKREDLVSLSNQYSDQNLVLTNNQKERNNLLQVTKNEERRYQQMLAERREARDQVLQELRDYENRLQFILDPKTIPPLGTQVFAWPLRNIIITQYFGGTEFARRNPSVYAGRPFHPGVDFGAPRGTPILAPLAGTVRDTGNTDLVPGCFSWGKWILVDHANGLSTLYAHLDVISVKPGQRVATGEIIGYTGNTGFSTGPHLHFTVYVRSGVTVRQFNEIRTVTSCGPAKTPVAATTAYIDPLMYLPPPPRRN